jgi:hypothetical protein
MDLKKVLPWISDNWVFLSTVIPSIIVALTPKESKGKVAKIIKMVLDRLSFLSHYNAKGTMKLPFTASKSLNKEEK